MEPALSGSPSVPPEQQPVQPQPVQPQPSTPPSAQPQPSKPPSAQPQPSKPPSAGPRSGVLVVWGDELLGYDLGDHPLDPVRVELTIALARTLGVLDRPGVHVVAPEPADDAALTRVHSASYLEAVRAAGAPVTPASGVAASGVAEADGARAGLGHAVGGWWPEDDLARWGLGTPDNPVFDRMHEVSALVAGATLRAAEAVWRNEVQRAVNIAGGLHHAMPARASGFCVYNDPAVAIARLLDLGAQRVAYVDVDVHHGDGVQAMFWDDPRVLTVSLHESPLTLFPGTGFPHEVGGPRALGSVVNLALPPGTGDSGWQRAFHAVVPSVLRAFQPEILFTQCGADTYRADPLANLRLTVDGQRAAYLALRSLADELCDGRWVATGGGGYALFEAVPRAWTHLLAILTGEPIPPQTPTPAAWRELAARRLDDGYAGDRPRLRLLPNGGGIPVRMTDGGSVRFARWQPSPDGEADAVDRAIAATRREVFPLLGLDPDDPRD